jgi:hypothetical protein
LIDGACDDSEKAELSKLSEEENFALKARYKHDNDTARWMDSKRMPVDESKVKDLLRYQHHFKNKIAEELNTFGEDVRQKQFEKGLLTYVNEASWGDLKELLTDVGINRHSIRFFNAGDVIKANGNTIHDSDKNWKYIEQNRHLQVDMTDYENDFPSVNEVGSAYLMNVNALGSIAQEKWP